MEVGYLWSRRRSLRRVAVESVHAAVMRLPRGAPDEHRMHSAAHTAPLAGEGPPTEVTRTFFRAERIRRRSPRRVASEGVHATVARSPSDAAPCRNPTRSAASATRPVGEGSLTEEAHFFRATSATETVSWRRRSATCLPLLARAKRRQEGRRGVPGGTCRASKQHRFDGGGMAMQAVHSPVLPSYHLLASAPPSPVDAE